MHSVGAVAVCERGGGPGSVGGVAGEEQDFQRRHPDDHNGGRAVIIGRFATALRVLVPGFSGMARIPYLKFSAHNAAGGILWATGFVLLGYAAGSQYQRVAHNATLFGLGLLVLIIIVLVTRKLRDRRRRAATSPRSHRCDPLAAQTAGCTAVEGWLAPWRLQGWCL